jgi:hypothetical protein
MFRHICLIAGCIASAGCATRYQDMGFSGGVTAQQITADRFRIVARGNGYTSRTTIDDFVLLKAAETTISQGGTHFVYVNGRDASRTATVTLPGQAQTQLIGNTAYTTYRPATHYEVSKPGQDVIIQVLRVPAGQLVPAGAQDAAEIISFVGPRVRS